MIGDQAPTSATRGPDPGENGTAGPHATSHDAAHPRSANARPRRFSPPRATGEGRRIDRSAPFRKVATTPNPERLEAPLRHNRNHVVDQENPHPPTIRARQENLIKDTTRDMSGETDITRVSLNTLATKHRSVATGMRNPHTRSPKRGRTRATGHLPQSSAGARDDTARPGSPLRTSERTRPPVRSRLP